MLSQKFYRVCPATIALFHCRVAATNELARQLGRIIFPGATSQKGKARQVQGWLREILLKRLVLG
jgi:hypothetical protein